MTQAANLAALGTSVNSSGNLASPTFTGQATIPTINLTGGQIAFPATQNPSSDANTLDDYEEGTWTPTLTNSTGYDQQYGRYVKIGRVVRLQAVINTTSFNNGVATSLEIGGFPFTIDYTNSLSIYPLGHVFPVVGWNFSGINALQLQGTPTTTKAIIYYVTSGTGSNYNNAFANQMASGQVNCEMSLTYIASA